jgi:outer membrane protein OmpA-like peptidoglycan-associated protein
MPRALLAVLVLNVAAGLLPAPLHAQPADWAATTHTARDTPEAALVARTGDVDNLGFGWPAGFDPFCGASTPVHGFPYEPEPDDPAGTDRIMVGSGYDGNPPRGQDGYVGTTSRPGNAPQAVELAFDLGGLAVEGALLQLFVDDFQAPLWGARYEVTLDGERVPAAEQVLNALEQTGPIGKLVTVPVLPEYLGLLRDGRLTLRIDDPATGAGDGFALDFVRLLVDPRAELPCAGTVSGTVVDAQTGAPIPGALVAAGAASGEADAQGRYRLARVPSGLVVAQASAPGYAPATEAVDLVGGDAVTVDFRLEPRAEEQATLEQELAETGEATLRGVYFDTDSDRLRPESEATLEAVRAVMEATAAARYVIEGHTDNQGGDDYNLALSERRAQAVVDWLVAHGIAADRLRAEGFGERRPVADNATAAGRAQNRRVTVQEVR